VAESENGAGLTGSFGRAAMPDLVQSLTIRGLRHFEADGDVASSAVQAAIENVLCQDMTDPGRLDRVPPELRGSVKGLHSALSAMRIQLCLLCEEALELPPGYLAKLCDASDAGLRLAFYPEQIVAPPAGQLRYGAHTDSGALTMVLLDPACPRGLEVQINPIANPSPEEQIWVDVCDGKAGVAIDTAVIINCGAVLERWTNGKWKSALHRVQNSREKRLSIVTSALTPRYNSSPAEHDRACRSCAYLPHIFHMLYFHSHISPACTHLTLRTYS
jgi:isopenicillin N synthase-like dioxygenase